MYLYFALFSAILLLYQMSHRGYAFQFLWPDSPEWANTALPVFMNLLGAFSALFIRSAMATDLASPRFNLFFRLFGYALFPLSAALTGAVALPAWAWLLPLALLLLVYPINAWRDAPLFPTPPGALRGLEAHAALADGGLGKRGPSRQALRG